MGSCSPAWRELEGDAAVRIGVFRGGYIQVGEWYFLRVLFGVDPEGLPDDGIVSRFGAVTVVKYQHGKGSAVVHLWDDGRCAIGVHST